MAASQELDDLMRRLLMLKSDLRVLVGQSISSSHIEESKETFSLELSTAVINECISLVKEAEMKEIDAVMNYKNHLKLKQCLVSKIFHFDCPFDILCEYISSIRSAKSKLSGTLINIWAHTNRMFNSLVRSLEAITDAHHLAHVKKVSDEKAELWKQLEDVFHGYQVQYVKYVKQLNKICSEIDDKLESERMRYMDLSNMKGYFNGTSQRFSVHVDEDDEANFLAKTFGERNRKDPQLKAILRESLISVAKRRDFDIVHFEHYQCHIAEYFEELNNLKDVLNGLIEHINTTTSTKLTKILITIHEHDLELHRAKDVIRRVFFQGVPSF